MSVYTYIRLYTHIFIYTLVVASTHLLPSSGHSTLYVRIYSTLYVRIYSTLYVRIYSSMYVRICEHISSVCMYVCIYMYICNGAREVCRYTLTPLFWAWHLLCMYICVYICVYISSMYVRYIYVYEVATMSRLLTIMCLFCRILSLSYGSFAKETYNFKEPTNRSQPTRVLFSGTRGRCMCTLAPFAWVLQSVCIRVYVYMQWYKRSVQVRPCSICLGIEFCMCACTSIYAVVEEVAASAHMLSLPKHCILFVSIFCLYVFMYASMNTYT